jgi:hypothetical protein
LEDIIVELVLSPEILPSEVKTPKTPVIKPTQTIQKPAVPTQNEGAQIPKSDQEAKKKIFPTKLDQIPPK